MGEATGLEVALLASARARGWVRNASRRIREELVHGVVVDHQSEGRCDWRTSPLSVALMMESHWSARRWSWKEVVMRRNEVKRKMRGREGFKKKRKKVKRWGVILSSGLIGKGKEARIKKSTCGLGFRGLRVLFMRGN